MAYSFASGSIVQVRQYAAMNGQRIMMVRTGIIQQTGGGTITGGNTVMQALLANTDQIGTWLEAWSNAASTDLTFQYLEAQVIFPVRYVVSSYNNATYTQGNRAGAAAPQNLAVAELLRSTGTGRHSRGVTHVCGIMDSDNNAGFLDPGSFPTFDALGLSLTAFVGVTASIVWYPVIYNRASPGTSELVDSFQTQNTLRTMSRRTVGRGA